MDPGGAPAVRHCRRGVGFRLDCLTLGEGLGCAPRIRPASVSAKRREVRWISRSASFVSSRGIALDTVSPDRPAATAAKELVSATLAKIAQASRSGRDMPMPAEVETMTFHRFCFRHYRHLLVG